jgi:iron complex transport system substrate-binding protein
MIRGKGLQERTVQRKVHAMKIWCESLDYRFELPDRPERVICLVSAATEALYAMGLGDRVAGVSCYCDRYVPHLNKPVAGDYLKIDTQRFEELEPDLVVVTTGLQRKLGLELAGRGLPVYALPLPNSFYGILENNVILGALMNEVLAGRALSRRMEEEAAAIRSRSPRNRPRVYVELWFGRHMRSIGGLTYIDDLVSLAGGDTVFADKRSGYLVPDFEKVVESRPDVFLLFAEEVYPVDPRRLMEERGWNNVLDVRIVESTVQRGQNLIQEGPSILETAAWLQDQLHG